MIAKVKLAKSFLEHEEGLNHLWIQLAAVGDVRKARIQLALPAGIHRLPNLNGYAEDQEAQILLDNPKQSTDLLIEIFTREPISCGEKTIQITLSYLEQEGTPICIEHKVSLTIANEEEIDDAGIDEEVVNKVKELRQRNAAIDIHEFREYPQPKLLRIDPAACSEWEKKYRVDGRQTGREAL